MLQNMTYFINVFLTSLSVFLSSEPMCYFVYMLIITWLIVLIIKIFTVKY